MMRIGRRRCSASMVSGGLFLAAAWALPYVSNRVFDALSVWQINAATPSTSGGFAIDLIQVKMR